MRVYCGVAGCDEGQLTTLDTVRAQLCGRHLAEKEREEQRQTESDAQELARLRREKEATR